MFKYICLASLIFLFVHQTLAQAIKTRVLDEAHVIGSHKNPKKKTIYKGFQGKRKGTFHAEEIALFIPNEEKVNGKITSLIFNLSTLRFNPNASTKDITLKNKALCVSFRLYTDIENFEKTTLHLHYDTVSVKKNEEKIIFDLSTSNISLPTTGIYSSIVCVGIYDGEQFVPYKELSTELKHQFVGEFSTKHAQPMTYLKNSDTHRFERLKRHYQGGFLNANFQIALEIEKSNK